MKNSFEEVLPYKVGGLLYTPAINIGIAEKLKNKSYSDLTSIAFCLEDSIKDEALEQAEIQIKKTLMEIKEKVSKENIPLIFIRIRNPNHMEKMIHILSSELDVLTGFILPKFDLSNANEYVGLITKINLASTQRLYIMPILESKMIADINSRNEVLINIKSILDEKKEYVLNIRVGGNDFSNLYGIRRSVYQSIYDVGVIRDILIDIINVFATDYVVSGPVWEYFGADTKEKWADGLIRELDLDRLNGFIGKTAIHPSQLPIILNSLKVAQSDYEDALKILNWVPNGHGVEKSANGSRMNEVKCHTNWANKIYKLAQIYGIKDVK